MRNICVSGIHTDAGKSCVSAALCAGLGYEYFKLVQAGSVTDADFVARLAPQVVRHAPGLMLATPASPHVGMAREGISADVLAIDPPRSEGVLVELAGGLYCPIGERGYMIDYIAAKRLPTFLVSRNYLGSINHTVLSLEALKARNIEVLGVIFSRERDADSEEFLARAYPELPFFFLADFGENFANFEDAARDLVGQIKRANIQI